MKDGSRNNGDSALQSRGRSPKRITREWRSLQGDPDIDHRSHLYAPIFDRQPLFDPRHSESSVSESSFRGRTTRAGDL